MDAFDDVVTEFSRHSAAQKEALAAWELATWTINCPLPNGAMVWRTYWRSTGLPVGGGISTPYDPEFLFPHALQQAP